MKHGGAHIGKLPQFGIGNGLDDLGILHNAGIRHEKPGNIRPVFIHVRLNGPCHNGTGNIAAATGEGFNAAVPLSSIKAGNHHVNLGGKLLGPVLRGFIVIGAVGVEADQLRSVIEGEAQIVCKEQTVEVFSAAGRIVGGSAVFDVFLNGVELSGDIRLEGKLPLDGCIPVVDLLPGHVEV